MIRVSGRKHEEEGETPDLDWVPVEVWTARGTESSAYQTSDFKRRLTVWRRKRRLRVLALLSSYCALFLIVFASSLMFFAGMGMTQEQHDRFKEFVVDKFTNLTRSNEPFLPKMFDDKQSIHVLLVGLDKDPPHRSDSVLVAHIDLTTYETRLLSIPRDLRIEMKSSNGEVTHDKLAHAFVYGGVEDVEYAVETMLNIVIDNYVVIKIDGMMKLIDALGGVEIDVDKDMRYRDRAQDLHINLKKGLQVLNGEDAVGYSRFRKDAEGDIGRMHRQQVLIKAVLIELRKPGNLLKIDEIVRLFYSAVETDLDLVQLLAIKQVTKEFTPDKIQSLTLNSESTDWDGISYQKATDDNIIQASQFLANLLPPLPESDLDANGESLPPNTTQVFDEHPSLLDESEVSGGF